MGYQMRCAERSRSILVFSKLRFEEQNLIPQSAALLTHRRRLTDA